MTAEWIAAYLDGGLSAAEREDLERHLVECADCRRDLAEASELTASSRHRWVLAALPAAAAAAIALAFFVGPNGAPPPGTGPVLRDGSGTIQLGAVAPSDGDVTDADSLVFTWRAAGLEAHYVFTLTDGDGDVVFTRGQPDTVLVLPRSVGLGLGQYYWVVDALLEGARATSTGFQGFIVE